MPPIPSLNYTVSNFRQPKEFEFTKNVVLFLFYFALIISIDPNDRP